MRTTCDLKLQEAAQAAVRRGVVRVDQRSGYRRSSGTRSVRDVDEARAAYEQRLRRAQAKARDPAGRVAASARSTLEPNEIYEGVVLEVQAKYAKVAIGAHVALVPLAWSRWVYAAAIESRRITAATRVIDAPLALANEVLWKPSNASSSFEGPMTVRSALAKSKNTATVRVLQAIDPGMHNDVVYRFARRLGLGRAPGPSLPKGHARTPDNDRLCPWVLESAKTVDCPDRHPPKDPGLSNAQHRRQLSRADVYLCRACDETMALGSTSLTMREVVRAYSAFNDGRLVEPYFIEEVRDREGVVLEAHSATKLNVLDPAVAARSSS